MALPTETITVIKNGKLIGPLDCNGQLLTNADPDSFPVGGPGNGGNDTGITTAILKGDGHHGFADAVAEVDYSTPTALAAKESTAAHDTDISTINGQISTINTSLAGKADASATTTALAGKESTTAHDADISTINGQISTINTSLSGKADTSAVNTALAAKADSTAVTTALAAKENTLPTTANDAYILARHNPGGGGAFFYVDPVTLGSTSGTYTDGSTHSNTTFNSPAQAVFTVNDNGKTIVSAGNIPSNTTITFVNATTVTLSNAATTTASPVTFTIINRFLAAGGGGTVTSVAVTNDGVTGIPDLVTVNVNNPTTSVGIVLSKPPVPAKTFYGNSSASPGNPAFMTQTNAFAALDISTAGKAIAQIVNPTVNSFPRIETTAGTVSGATARSASQVLGDIGAEPALTFSSPLTRGAAPNTGTISIPAATDTAPGHLSASDHAAFAAKLSGSRIITTTAPLLIDNVASANLTADRTLSMPAASGSPAVSGYLTGTDWGTFNAKVPPTRTLTATAPLRIGTPLASGVALDLSANRVFDILKASTTQDGYLAASDFATFLSGGSIPQAITQTSGSITLGSPAAPAPPLNRIIIANTLTGNLNIVLPSATIYNAAAGYPFIEFVDLANPAAQTNFGITLRAAAGQSIDGVIATPSDFVMPRGMAYVRLNSDGGTRWTTTKYYVNTVIQPDDPTKRFTFDASAQTGGATPVTGRVKAAAGNSVTIVPTQGSQVAGVVTEINNDGTATKTRPTPATLLPKEFIVGTSGQPLSGAPQTVTDQDPGIYDTVRIAGSLTAPISLIWPLANHYDSGQAITLLDSSGSVSKTAPITVVSSGSDTFSGQPSGFLFSETRGFRVLISDGISEWTVSSSKASIQPYQQVTPSGNTFTIFTDGNVAKQNAHLNLLNGVNNLSIVGGSDGMDIELVLVQPSTGARGTVTLPTISYTPAGGLGLVTLTDGSTTPGAIDRLRGIYDGVLGGYLWNLPILNETTAVPPTAPSAMTAGSITSASVTIGWTDNSANETGFEVERASGASQTSGFARITTTAANAVTYTDTGLSGGASYTYRVRAINQGGASGYATSINVTALAGGAPADLLEWHFNETSGVGVTSTGPGPAGTMSIELRSTSTQSGTGKCFAPVIGMASTGTLAIANIGGTGLQRWDYRVQGVKSASSGNHNVGTLISTTTGVTDLNIGTFNHITWGAVTGADTYRVYRVFATGGTINGSPANTGLIVSNIPFGTNAFDDTGIIANPATIPPDVGTSTDIATATANSSVTYSQVLSISFWVKATFPSVTSNIISGGTTVFQIQQFSGSKLQVTFPRGTGSITGQVSNTALADGNWHHVAVVMDNSQNTSITTGNGPTDTIRVYYDGSATQRTVTFTGTIGSGSKTFTASAPIVGSSNFAGFIDDIRLFNRLLNTTEIAGLFSGNAQ